MTNSPSNRAFYSLFPVPYSPIPSLNVIQITVSKYSPLFGVQSNETNQLDRFFICMRKCLLNTIRCKSHPFAAEFK
jgi:hypothetical protein